MSNLEIFNRRILSEKLTLVDFFSKKHVSSRTMQAILKIVAYRLEKQIRIMSIDIDVRTNQEIVNQYLIKKRPVFMLFQNGLIKWQDSGTFSSRKMIKIIDEQLSNSDSNLNSN